MRGILTVLSLISLIWLASCGGVTKEEFDKRIAELEGRIAQLEDRQRSLEERNLRTEARVDTLSEGLARTRLEVERLKLERQNPATKLPEPVREKPQPIEMVPEKLQEAPQVQQTNLQQTVENYQKEYDEALKLYNLKQLNQARDKFIDFIKKYPATPLTDNAYLWLGVVYRDLGEINKAEAVWLTLVERCQKKEMVDCNKVPSALLQLARVYEQRGDNQKARQYYEAILKDYPLSEEAGIAKTRLGR